MKVYSSEKEVMALEVNKDTVYLRENISYVITDDFEGWEYDEEQMPLDNFIAKLQLENQTLRTEQTQTNTTLLELMEVVLIGGT